MRILIAEDEKDISELYKLTLEERGHSVVLTNNGETCLKKYIEELNLSKITGSITPFDVVLADIKMPELDGVSLARTIIKLCPEQRMIFASAFVKETLSRILKEVDMVIAVMHKPFKLESLINLIEDTKTANMVNEINSNVREMSKFKESDQKIKQIIERVWQVKQQDVFYAYGDFLVC